MENCNHYRYAYSVVTVVMSTTSYIIQIYNTMYVSVATGSSNHTEYEMILCCQGSGVRLQGIGIEFVLVQGHVAVVSTPDSHGTTQKLYT